MTGQLRKEAKASGWPRHIVGNMGVIYEDNRFQVHVHDRHFDEAQALEYGTEESRPTAAIRRAGNRTKEADNFFMDSLKNALGEL